MKQILMISAAALALGTTSAFADQKPSAEEVAKITAVLADLGCKDPEEIEKENEGHFEIEDANCKEGQFDIKLDKDFKLISMSRD